MKPWHQENGIISPEFTFEFYSDKVLEYSRRLPTLKEQLSYLIDVCAYYRDEKTKYMMDPFPDGHPCLNDTLFLTRLGTEVSRLKSQISLETNQANSEQTPLRNALRSDKLYDYLIKELSNPEFNIFDRQGNFVYKGRDRRRVAVALGDTLCIKGYFKPGIDWSVQNKSSLTLKWLGVEVGEKSSTLIKSNFRQMRKFVFLKAANEIL